MRSVTCRACYAGDVRQERVPRTLHMTLIPHPTPTPTQRANLKKVAKRTYGFPAVGKYRLHPLHACKKMQKESILGKLGEGIIVTLNPRPINAQKIRLGNFLPNS